MGKKIALAVPTLSNGGAERTVSVWADALLERGYGVSVVLFHRSEGEYGVRGEIPIYALAAEKAAYKSMSPWEKYAGLRGILKGIDADYVISFLPGPQAWVMLSAWGLRVKRIETLRNNPRHGKAYTNLFYRAGWRLCYLTGHRIILQTKAQLQFFSRWERRKCVVIPNQLSRRFAESCKEEMSENPAEFIAVGRLFRQKNYKMMIDAFSQVCRRHDGLRLRIFGKGEAADRAQLQGWIDAAGLGERVRLMGWSARLEEEYKKSDIFLLTSNYEGLPNALMEAMASRLICVSTDCETGPRDLIEPGVTGFLAPVGDSAAFAEAIEGALGLSAGERSAMADAARRKVREYCSPARSVDALCGCFEE